MSQFNLPQSLLTLSCNFDWPTALLQFRSRTFQPLIDQIVVAERLIEMWEERDSHELQLSEQNEAS